MKLMLCEQVVCNDQGRMFQLSGKQGYASHDFIEKFMNSDVAARMDMPYDRSQWMGEGYLFEELVDECSLLKGDPADIYDAEVLFWMGYLYRYWHYYKAAPSREIYALADANLLNRCWLGYHTLDLEMAIDRLIEAHESNLGSIDTD